MVDPRCAVRGGRHAADEWIAGTEAGNGRMPARQKPDGVHSRERQRRKLSILSPEVRHVPEDPGCSRSENNRAHSML